MKFNSYVFLEAMQRDCCQRQGLSLVVTGQSWSDSTLPQVRDAFLYIILCRCSVSKFMCSLHVSERHEETYFII